MYKLIIFFLNYNALEDISQCRFHEYELQQQTSKTHLLIFEGDENILIMKSFSQILSKSMGK